MTAANLPALREASDLLREAADALEQAEKELRTITSCESGIWGGACPSCQRAARAALAALAGRDKQEDG